MRIGTKWAERASQELLLSSRISQGSTQLQVKVVCRPGAGREPRSSSGPPGPALSLPLVLQTRVCSPRGCTCLPASFVPDASSGDSPRRLRMFVWTRRRAKHLGPGVGVRTQRRGRRGAEAAGRVAQCGNGVLGRVCTEEMSVHLGDDSGTGAGDKPRSAVRWPRIGVISLGAHAGPPQRQSQPWSPVLRTRVQRAASPLPERGAEHVRDVGPPPPDTTSCLKTEQCAGGQRTDDEGEGRGDSARARAARARARASWARA